MRILLDTHAFLWLILESTRLPLRSRELYRTERRVALSIVSIWEIVVKTRIGKLLLPEPAYQFVNKQLQLNNIELLPLLPAHLAELEVLPLLHKDPFDHLLIAQAKAEGMALMSGDQAIARYPVEVIWQ